MFSGSITDRYGREIARRVSMTTYATSEAKAKSNIAHQFKQQNNMVPGVKITLCGKLTQESTA